MTMVYDYDMIISISIRQKPQETHLKLKWKASQRKSNLNSLKTENDQRARPQFLADVVCMHGSVKGIFKTDRLSNAVKGLNPGVIS